MTPNSDNYRSDPEYVRQRRKIVREHHPDRGGDPEAMIAELANLDHEWGQKYGYRTSRSHDDFSRIPFPEELRKYIPEEVWEEAVRRAAIYADRAESFARKANTFSTRTRSAVANNVVFSSSTPRTALRKARRVATAASRTFRSQLPSSFPGAKKYSGSPSQGSTTSSSDRKKNS